MSEISGRAPTSRLRDPGRGGPTRDCFFNGMGGRSTVNGGHLLAFNVPWLHRGPAIVRRRTEDCTRPESMIRQRLGHAVRHDTTGGDVYLRCLSLFHFPRDPSERILDVLSSDAPPKKSLRNNFYLVASLWRVYAAVLVTSKTTILRFQPNEKELRLKLVDREVKDPRQRNEVFFSKHNGPTNIYNYLK